MTDLSTFAAVVLRLCGRRRLWMGDNATTPGCVAEAQTGMGCGIARGDILSLRSTAAADHRKKIGVVMCEQTTVDVSVSSSQGEGQAEGCSPVRKDGDDGNFGD